MEKITLPLDRRFDMELTHKVYKACLFIHKNCNDIEMSLENRIFRYFEPCLDTQDDLVMRLGGMKI